MSNYNSIYYFAERYQCKELLTNIKKFIRSNLVAEANEEHFLNLPCHEVEQLISSDDIHVSAEEDVFKTILNRNGSITIKTSERKTFKIYFSMCGYLFYRVTVWRTKYQQTVWCRKTEDCLCDVKFTLERMHDLPLLYPPDLSTLSPRIVLQPEVLVACERTDRTVSGFICLMKTYGINCQTCQTC